MTISMKEEKENVPSVVFTVDQRDWVDTLAELTQDVRLMYPLRKLHGMKYFFYNTKYVQYHYHKSEK